MKIPRSGVSEIRRCWRSSAVLLSWFAVCITALFFPVNANAFKAETHVWVGQQVLNDLQEDLEDGRVTIKIGNDIFEYPVDSSVVSALKAYPDMFRMGSIGPDAFPDMFTGQFVVHPGIDGAWQTDDWLKWIYKGAESPQEKAFAYGYLAHAATDVFSHTYVNNYSGDIFVLGDGEIENEKRHFALEKYIVQHTPPLKDANGVQIGQPYSVLNTPSSFMNSNLILNNTVAGQYSSGGALHLAAIQNLRERLYNAYGPLDKLDIWIVQVLTEYYLNITLNSEQAAQIYGYAQNINQIISNNNGIDELQKAKDDLVNAVVKTGEIGIDLQDRLSDALTDFLEISGRLDAKLQELTQNEDLYKLQFDACYIPQTAICKNNAHCDDLYPGSARDACRNWCNSTTTSLCNGNLQVILDTIQVITAAKRAIEGELLQANEMLTEAVGLVVTAANENLEAQNVIINGLVDTTQLMTGDLNMIRAEVDGWRSDIVTGMDAYVLANAEVIKESMKDGGDLLTPIKDWIDCWAAPVFMGIPSSISNGICSVQNRVEKMSNAISDFEAKMGKIVPIIGEWNELKQKITDEINSAVNKEAMELLKEKTGVDVQVIVDLIKNPVDDDMLNSIFSFDEPIKHLPLIPDIAQRVTAEMQLSPDGYFDPEKYEVANNSVVLAKLALLNREQLNKFAADAGVTLPTSYGDQLYPEDGLVNSSNIIFGFIRSIDGNHQWLQFAPPDQRQTNYPDLDLPEVRHYGYGRVSSADGYTGLRIWEYSNARENAFLRVFSGSFSDAGMQDPIVYNLTISKAGNGLGAVTSNPAGISCGTDCSEHYVQGDSVTLTATPSTESLFAGWSGGGCSGTGTCVVTMDAAVSVTATFIQPTLTVTKNGTGSGTVTSSPAGISCGTDCTEVYPASTTVTLTASPSSGSSFAGWSGGGCSGIGVCVTKVDTDITVTATFGQPTKTLTVTANDAGAGYIISSDYDTSDEESGGILCGSRGSECTEAYLVGTSVTLTAKAANTNSVFTGWSGGGCSGTGACVVSMNVDRTVTATFAVNTTDTYDNCRENSMNYNDTCNSNNMDAFTCPSTGSLSCIDVMWDDDDGWYEYRKVTCR